MASSQQFPPMNGQHGMLPPGNYNYHPYGQVLTQPGFVLPAQSQLTPPELSGYCFYDGRAYENCQGKHAVRMLNYKQISLENGPPFEHVVNENMRFKKHGVVKIGNIPFTVTAQEIVQFINRFAPTGMIEKHHEGYPIHIIMEKPTGKTMDCFIEFPSVQAARSCVKRYEDLDFGKYTKIGARHVTVDCSDQAELMEAVFPRARLVKFSKKTGKPSLRTETEEHSAWSNSFRGFFTLEEVFGVVRYAEHPNRSPFIMKCHQRVYESMVSTLYKFPWTATGMYSVAARNALFEAVYKQLNTLAPKVDLTADPKPGPMKLFEYNKFEFTLRQDLNVDREVGLSQSLLLDLLFAAMNVPAFSLLQKAILCGVVGSYGRGLGLTQFAQHWPFQTLGPARNAPDHLIRFWLEMFDAGYERRSMTGRPTTFEKYINFARNEVGFLVAEWTKVGIELPFSVATRMERAAMMVYLDEGCQHWCYERHIHVVTLNTSTLKEFIASDATKKGIKNTFNDDSDDESQSLKGVFPPKAPSANRLTMVGPSSSVNPEATRSVAQKSIFNPATAIEFVPSGLQVECGTCTENSGVTPPTTSDSNSSPNSKSVQKPIPDSTRQGTTESPPVFRDPWHANTNSINESDNARATG